MTEYHERPFNQRIGAMGDKAEAAFTEVNPNAHRLGLNRPALNMRVMHANLRYTPDFLLEDGAYEVMGFSSRGNGTLKLKFDKADALRSWDMLIPTFLWVYDSGMRRYWCAPIRMWLDACYDHATRERFSDNDNLYWDLPFVHFPGGAVPC